MKEMMTICFWPVFTLAMDDDSDIKTPLAMKALGAVLAVALLPVCAVVAMVMGAWRVVKKD